MNNISPQRLGLFMAVVTALSWSALAILLKLALNFASSGTIAFIRFAVAALALALLLGIFKKEHIYSAFKIPWGIYIAGAGLALNYFAFMKGIEYTSPSNAQIFIQISQVLLVAVSLSYFKEYLTGVQKLGFLIAALGFVLFYWDQANQSQSFSDTFTLGVGWTVIASIAWVLFAVIQKILSRVWDPQSINFLIYIMCSIFLLPVTTPSEIGQWSFWVWILMISLGLNTLIAYGALGYALKMAPANQVGLIISCNPILTIFFMQILMLLGAEWITPEKLGPASYIGAAVVVSGVGLAVQKSRGKVSSPRV